MPPQALSDLLLHSFELVEAEASDQESLDNLPLKNGQAAHSPARVCSCNCQCGTASNNGGTPYCYPCGPTSSCNVSSGS